MCLGGGLVLRGGKERTAIPGEGASLCNKRGGKTPIFSKAKRKREREKKTTSEIFLPKGGREEGPASVQERRPLLQCHIGAKRIRRKEREEKEGGQLAQWPALNVKKT